jgi:hypothetical protein
VLQLLVTAHVVPSSRILFALMIGAISSSETSVLIRTTRSNIPEDGNLHSHSREDLKSYMKVSALLSFWCAARNQKYFELITDVQTLWNLGPSRQIVVTAYVFESNKFTWSSILICVLISNILLIRKLGLWSVSVEVQAEGLYLMVNCTDYNIVFPKIM